MVMNKNGIMQSEYLIDTKICSALLIQITLFKIKLRSISFKFHVFEIYSLERSKFQR